MLNSNKRVKLLNALKAYHKTYIKKDYKDLDESGTRLMINSFLTDVLGYKLIDEIKTEHGIKGTYADYVIQIKGVQHFLVEAKSLSLVLSAKHLRQATDYGYREGIDWVLLTNGKCFNFYKIIFEKPVRDIKLFSIDLTDANDLKKHIDVFQYLHKESVVKKGLNVLWNKCNALDPANVSGFLYTPKVINFLRKSLQAKYKHKFTDEEIKTSLNKIVYEAIQLEDIKQVKTKKKKSKQDSNNAVATTSTIIEATPVVQPQ